METSVTMEFDKGNDESTELSATFNAISNALSQISRQLKDNSDENQKTRTAVKEVGRDLEDFKGDVRNEIDGVKESQCLEPWQAAKVQEAAKTRVAKILNDWCEDNDVESDTVYCKYYGKFVRAIHHDAKKLGLEIGKIVYTPKRNYQMLLDFIGEWYPKRGVSGQMEHYDKLQSIRQASL